MNKTVIILAFFVAAVLAGYFFQTMSIPPPAKPSKDVDPDDASPAKETFMQRQAGMPLDMQNTTGVTGYAASSPILGSEPKPLSEKPYDMANDQELFQFEGNRISADCCPSPFSSDRGCVCLTDKDIAVFNSRGGNRA
jgi:hypothetical protein